MTGDKTKDVLDSLGFDEKERRVYLALLDLDEATAATIADYSSISRPLIYEVATRLEQDGHITRFDDEGTTVFRSRNPSHLLEQLQDRRRRVESVLPRLQERFDSTVDDLEADVSRGKEALRAGLDHVGRHADTVRVLGETNQFADVIPVAIQSYLDDINDDSITERVIKPSGAEPVEHDAVTTRFVDTPLPTTTTVIYPPHVATFLWSKPYGVIRVANEDTARSYQAYFDALWEQAA